MYQVSLTTRWAFAASSQIAAEVSGYVKLPPNDYARVMHAVATIGPLSVNVDATKFFLYREGIFTACENTSTSDIDHAVCSRRDETVFFRDRLHFSVRVRTGWLNGTPLFPGRPCRIRHRRRYGPGLLVRILAVRLRCPRERRRSFVLTDDPTSPAAQADPQLLVNCLGRERLHAPQAHARHPLL